MYVCLCHGLTDHKIKELAASGTRTAAGVYQQLGVRPKCGKCVPYVRDMVKDGHEGCSGGACSCGR